MDINLVVIEGKLTTVVSVNKEWGIFKVSTYQGECVIHTKGKLTKMCVKYLCINSHILVAGTMVFGDKTHLDAKEIKFLSPTKENINVNTNDK